MFDGIQRLRNELSWNKFILYCRLIASQIAAFSRADTLPGIPNYTPSPAPLSTPDHYYYFRCGRPSNALTLYSSRHSYSSIVYLTNYFSICRSGTARRVIHRRNVPFINSYSNRCHHVHAQMIFYPLHGYNEHIRD